MQYDDLEEFLGEGWHFRVANTSGDFSFLAIKTIKFYLKKPTRL